MATLQQITNDVKAVLPIYNTTLYDTELNILVSGAIAKLEHEGIGNVFEHGTNNYYDYIVCVRYQVACDMDLDIDISRLKEQYITRVNTLRCILNQA